MLSRYDEAVIARSEWVEEGDIWWLKVTTNVTDDCCFRITGSNKSNLPTNRQSDYAAGFAVGETVRVWQLGTMPIASRVLAGIAKGHNIMVGIMDDGLTDLCGKLVFARYVNMTGDPSLATDEMMSVANEAADAFGRGGKQAARQHLESSGLFDLVREDRHGLLTGPGKTDCRELR